MKRYLFILLSGCGMLSCQRNEPATAEQIQLIGKMIKIINDSHFSFLNHDLNKGKDSIAGQFVAGGGRYQLNGDQYTEHLEYCSDRQWEGNDFFFTVTIQNDTLTQRGVEKVQGTSIDRMNIEKYVRVEPR